VAQIDGKDPANSDADPLERWLIEARPWIVALIAAAFETLGTETRDALHIQVTAEKLISAALQAREWQFDHPCPVPVIADEFTGIVNTFGALAEECAVLAETAPDGGSPDFDGRLESAVSALYEAERAVGHGEGFLGKSK
jgi:hypothetical protein